MLKPCHLSYFLLFFVFFIPQISFSCPQDQIQSLLEFKNLLTRDINNQSTAIITLEGLKTCRPNSDCCKWQLVRCSTRSPTREVIDLNLHSLILSGLVSSSVLRPVLHSLILSGLVSSSVLRPVRRISSLVTLDISSNFIQGEIPGDGFVNLTSFISLDMSDNSFNGSIPPELFSLKNLQCLDLSRNDVECLAQLRTLTLRQNLFSGSIPLSVSQLTKLETFDLQNNYLSFEIPDGIGKLANISTLSLSMNKLSGGIPSSIQNLTNLETLELENNNGLYGEIPTWLFGLQKLKILRLGGNKFQWNKNVSVYAQSKLTHLSLRSCGLEGNIPDWLKNQTALLPGSEHEQTRRKFSQMIPDTVGETWVMILMLSENNFSGSVPKSISKIHRLLLLDLSKNKLSGECPCFDPESLLALLDISSNEFSGDVPAFFGSNTIMLSMSQNNFSGEFPHDFTNLPSLMHLDLHDNKISGNVPSFISRLSSSLEVLDLSENNLDGSLPSSLGNLTSMTESLPSSSSPLPFMYSFTIEIHDLAVNWKNSKQGEIPQTLSKLRELNVLELRNNKLTGRSRIPESPQLDRLNDPNIYANNNKLCGMQIQEPSSTQTKQPEEDKEETMFSWKAAVIGCPCGFLMAVVVMYMVGYFSDSSVTTFVEM
ncbi:Leucine-rich repeat [Arabidopsis suecica]|uniref:Leucine-rich repeat n=1 Tax=Arabidopsis suecica TaxID=45249 RepID=A0A8T2B0U8_ARASU|nr:Leucine-rich repeat [Arabidopsis suecica]